MTQRCRRSVCAILLPPMALLAQQQIASSNAVAAGATSPTGNTTSLKWIDKTPDAILADVNFALTTCWTNSGWALMPTELRVPPVEFGYLVSQKVIDGRQCVGAGVPAQQLAVQRGVRQAA